MSGPADFTPAKNPQPIAIIAIIAINRLFVFLTLLKVFRINFFFIISPLYVKFYHSMVSTATGFSFSVTRETLLFLIFITRSAIGAIA